MYISAGAFFSIVVILWAMFATKEDWNGMFDIIKLLLLLAGIAVCIAVPIAAWLGFFSLPKTYRDLAILVPAGMWAVYEAVKYFTAPSKVEASSASEETK